MCEAPPAVADPNAVLGACDLNETSFLLDSQTCAIGCAEGYLLSGMDNAILRYKSPQVHE
jgi:hypothetical protein